MSRVPSVLQYPFICMASLLLVVLCVSQTALAEDLKVGSAAVELVADDSMDIGGGILPWKANGQEGKLRASALVVQDANGVRVAIVSCDVLFVERDFCDPAAARIEKETGIPASHVLMHATHTHSAPTTSTIHGYVRDNVFTQRVQDAIVESVKQADQRCKESGPATMRFRLGEESSVGQNSRLLLADGTIFWTGSHADAVRPTGPFDPELPVISFVNKESRPIAVLFNHSTHTIGAREPGKRSPAFYGLAAQELEAAHGGVFLFLEGASGSTHNLYLKPDEMVVRIKASVERALSQSEPREAVRLAAIKEPFEFKVRMFDELTEDNAVRTYCSRRYTNPKDVEVVSGVFRDMRRKLSPDQGKTRSTWIQTILLGDVAIVGVPAEFFTRLGLEIKRRSPFRYTYVAELSNDWVGYVPDTEGFKLGGYQVWTGLHSYCEPGTGERVVEAALDQLRRLKAQSSSASQ